MESEVKLTNGKGTVQLDRVLQVHDLTHNLFSVSSLCDADHTVLFTKHKCVVQKEKIVGYSKRDERMYSVEVEKVDDRTLTAVDKYGRLLKM